MAKENTPAPVLDLETFPVRPTVRIDGAVYELRTVNDFSLVEYESLDRGWPRLVALLTLSAKPVFPKKLHSELSQRLDAMCRLALVAPDEVHKRLGDALRVIIIRAFFEHLPTMAGTAATMTQPVKPAPATASPGKTSARAFRRSTGAIR